MGLSEDAGKEASGGMLAILMLIHQRDENNAAGARESGQGGGQGPGPACREGPLEESGRGLRRREELVGELNIS